MFYNVKKEQIFHISYNYKSDIINLYMVGKTLPNASWTALHTSGHNPRDLKYTFEYILNGRMVIDTNNGKKTAKKGDFLFMNKKSTHYSYTDIEDPVEKIFIVVNGSLIDKMVDLYKLNSPLIIYQLDIREFLEEIILAAKQENPQIDDVAIVNILKICQKYNRAVYDDSEDSASVKKEPKPIDEISQYILANIDKNITLSHLSNIFYISESQIIRLFKKNFNTTPKQFIQQQKIAIAKEMLSYTSFDMDTIAFKLGYSDRNNFSTAFSKKVGMSPKQYKKQFPYIVKTLDSK
ncbi:MAG: helix-turn-helix transcriptional regulator [Clostridia bacterium]|nr:helix-turn-helix transcriptional regulator [Clostridia bacterium]